MRNVGAASPHPARSEPGPSGSVAPSPSLGVPRIGGICLPNPFLMAPMAGVTDSAVRVLARRYQCGLVTTEMVSSHLLSVRGVEPCLGRLSWEAAEKPLAIQIFGAEADIMAEAARQVEASGADIVDLNLGCSVPKVVRVGGGAALCRRPLDLARILEKVVAAVQVPVTVKIRKGWDASHLSAFEVLRVAENCGVAALAIHARTSRQAYGGVADWEFIARLKAAARIPIIGNGDVFSASDAVRMLETTACDAVMIGRASRGNPWIFRECVHLWETGVPLPPPSIQERLQVILEHLERVREAAEAAGGNGILAFRRFLGWYVRGYRNAAEFRERACRLSKAGEMLRAVEEFFAQQPEGPTPGREPASEPLPFPPD